MSNSYSMEEKFEIIPEEDHVNYEKLYSFSYLKEADNPHLSPSLRNEVVKNSTKYNTYPFDLPRDNVQKTTICFRNKDGSRPQDLILDHELVEKVCDLGHIIVEGNVDLLPLSLLKWGVFDLHFWGEGALQSLRSFNTVLNHWIHDGCTLCQGIDIVIPKIIDQKTELLDIVRSILCQSESLKTLSIRFAGFTTEDCNQLFRTLISFNHQLQTLVLSFNDLDSEVLLESGCISEFFRDFIHFPNLRFVDIRGNNFDGAFPEYLSNAIQNRVLSTPLTEEEKRAFPFLRIGISGVNEILSNDVGVINNEQYFPMEGKLTPWQINIYSETKIRDKFKRIFHHLKPEYALNKEFFIPYHEEQALPYADIADQLLMIRYGHMPIEMFDLYGFKFKHSSYPEPNYNAFILWLLSVHIQDRSHLVYYGISENNDDFFHRLILSFLRSTQIDECSFHHCFG